MSTFFSKTLIYASTFRCYWCSLDSSQALQGCVAYIGANTTYRLPIFEAKIHEFKNNYKCKYHVQIVHPLFGGNSKYKYHPTLFLVSS